MTRVLLYTGKGGVGKTTSAAGTATLAALRGLRTLVLSTDAAHSLSDAFDSEVGREPTEIDDLLFVQQIDAQRRFERSWGDIQAYLRSVLHMVGVDPIEAEELTVLPGAEEVLALLEVRDHVRSGRWDVIVVDCAPTAETLRLLALPEALNWYMDRIFNAERKVMRTFRPFLSRASGIPMPDDTVFDALRRLQSDLSDIRTLLAGPDASVRLVLTPEAVVVAEARRSLTRAVAVRLPRGRRGGEPGVPGRRRRHLAAAVGRRAARDPRGGRRLVPAAADLGVAVPGL